MQTTLPVISPEMLFGVDQSSISELDGVQMQSAVVPYWQRLQACAKQAGFELCAASAYRSFERQLIIWNAKASGQRPLYDQHEQVLDVSRMDPEEILWAILRWSALPGASRHHWGTEFDVFDACSLPENYQLQLTLEETRDDGIQGRFYQWLQGYLVGSDFFRPYMGQNAVSHEPWHLSCRPVSECFQHALDSNQLYDFIAERDDLLLKNQVLQNFDRIFSEYVLI